ncbi:MAG TPA: PAS domain-containing protein, partial [Sphaerochaeta sp.]|nr:PAS domain-containing protein [Sphaerochaeta sp.]
YRWNFSMSGKEDVLEQSGDKVQLPSGTFTLEELTCMLNSMPSDITFVGKDDKVRYFSEGKERVFPRTRSIIGREVAHCHPPKSLHVVEKLIDDFKAGLKDEESFWLQRGDQFVLIRYYAVRSVSGEYLGVMEVTEEISKLRSLEGNKLLAD